MLRQTSRFLIPWILCVSITVAADAPYKMLNKALVGGVTGWDYLTADSEARRLYITHGTRVEILDMDTLQVRATIPWTPGVHGVAIAPSLGKGFISQGRLDSVVVFDLKSLKKTTEVLAGKNPDAVVFDPVTSRVFAFNSHGNTATVIDARGEDYVSDIKLPGRPEFAIASGDGRVYVAILDNNSVARIDTRGLGVAEIWPVKGCVEPTGLAFDNAHHRLFVGCQNKTMAVVDSDSGKTVASVPIGARVDATLFDPGVSLIFNSNGDGTLTVIHQDSPDVYRVVSSVPTQVGSRTAAIDIKTHHVFLAAAEFGTPEPPAPGRPYARTPILPNTFSIWVIGP